MDSATKLAATLASVFAHQGATLEARLLKTGVAELQETNYDNWNGGTYTYSFVVRVPVPVFALLGDEQGQVEKRILEYLGRLLRVETHEFVNEVVLTPDAALTAGDGDEPAGINDNDHPMWPPNHFRLFLSHVSKIKLQVTHLKAALARHNIAGFVAHVDIEPTRDWQDVIEGALRTMDALVALVTPDFVGSKWCDQEVGFAIGRGRLVVPVRIDADPHGFLGRYQGVQGKGLSAAEMAERLVCVLAKNDRTSRRLAEAALRGFEAADSFTQAKQGMKTLEMFDSIPLEFLRAVEPAIETNVDLREAFGVPERFRKLLARHGAKEHSQFAR